MKSAYLKIIIWILGVIILLMATILFAQTKDKNNTSYSETTNTNDWVKNQKKAEKIEIVLFHATQRCVSCNLMEELSKKTLEENFKDEFNSWKITFKEINGEDPVNNEIVMKYKATGLSVFINSIVDSKDNIEEEKNLWRYIQNDVQFKEYLTEKLKSL